MPGNKQLYNEQMNAGHEAAWNHDWADAANAYGRALQEFPDDAEAHLSLGFSLLRAERLNEALRVYGRAHQLVPDDPIPLEKSADVLQRMGRLEESAKQYANVADAYLKQRDLDKAISSWEKATELSPGYVTLHAKLAKAYVRIGDRRRAVYHYLMLAFHFSRSGDWTQATRAAQQALKLNKKNVEALNALRAAESASQVSLPTPVKPDEATEAAPVEDIDLLEFGDLNDDSGPRVVEVDPLGPMGGAMSVALSSLADHIMMSGGFEAGGVEALQAMEFQRQGLYSEAITAYQSAGQQLGHPALKLNMGVLLLLSEQPAESLKPLADAVQDEMFKAGAAHAMGQAYFRQDKFKTAIGYLIQAAQLSDMGFTTDSHEISDINMVYPSVLEAAGKRKENDETVGAACRRLSKLMSGREWNRRLRDIRFQMVEAHRDGGPDRVLEFLAEDIGDDVPESIAKIDRFIRQGMYTLAMDEAQYAIEKAPSYLPIHVRMAEVMMMEGRVRQAINKYNSVAKTYRVRGENSRAASILVEVLEMAPLDENVRRNLIELLENEERWDEALDQYIELATTYRQLGNLDMARNTFAEAERISDRYEVPVDKMVSIKHQMADIDQLRMDTRRAQRVFEDILRLDPDDEKARKALIDINLQIGNQIEGIKLLDELLRAYAKRKQVKNILAVLQELVRSFPDDSGLRSRLAAIFRQLGRTDEAVEQMDKLAELQLDAGLRDEACNTVRQIVKLNTPDADRYRELLESLGC
ncbi:MAG: tetratricopeptide repeat protein [Chloroflexota bacterium]